MKKNFTKALAAMLLCVGLDAVGQSTTVILDFEPAGRSGVFQYFGSSLEPTTTQVVDNPFSTGINTSAKVSNFKKVVGAQTWAGAFSTALPVPVNVVNGGQICIKALFKQAGGNVTLKLEQSSTGGPNWVRTINNTGAVDTWQEFCFDVTQPSIEAPNQPAAGHSYDRVVLFADFGEVPTAERNYFFDDLVVKTPAATNKQVTFQVNMRGQAFSNVFVNGSFNNWTPKRLTKLPNDSIWTGTLSIPTGSYAYQFALDSPVVRKEVFNGFETCTKNDTTRREVYRTLTVARDTTFPVVCYNSCYNCGDGVKITFRLGTSHIQVSPTGIYLAGGGNFGNPGDFPLTAGAGGVYSITVERAKNFESFYTFTNGKCPDYSCKENIAGQSCANPANFNDRKLNVVTRDTVVSSCFALCTTTTACATVDSVNITFRVNMRRYTSAFQQVYVSGTFNNWAGTSNPLTRPVGADSIWKATIRVQKGLDYDFKYQLDNWVAQEQFTAAHAACTKLDPSGQFRNRFVRSMSDTTLLDYCFNACYNCVRVGTDPLERSQDLFKLYPTLSDEGFVLEVNDAYSGEGQIQLFNALGAVVEMQPLGVSKQHIVTRHLANGLYWVSLRVGNHYQTQKVMVQH